MRLIAVLLILAFGLVAYVRLAPTRPSKWHKHPAVTGPGDITQEGSFLCTRRINGAPQEVFVAVEACIAATPRTKLIKGSIDDRLMTFETRSLVVGFPDYTTVAITDDLLIIYGRLRFGRKDLGVNRTRIAGWLETLGPLTTPL